MDRVKNMPPFALGGWIGIVLSLAVLAVAGHDDAGGRSAVPPPAAGFVDVGRCAELDRAYADGTPVADADSDPPLAGLQLEALDARVATYLPPDGPIDEIQEIDPTQLYTGFLAEPESTQYLVMARWEAPLEDLLERYEETATSVSVAGGTRAYGQLANVVLEVGETGTHVTTARCDEAGWYVLTTEVRSPVEEACSTAVRDRCQRAWDLALEVAETGIFPERTARTISIAGDTATVEVKVTKGGSLFRAASQYLDVLSGWTWAERPTCEPSTTVLPGFGTIEIEDPTCRFGPPTLPTDGPSTNTFTIVEGQTALTVVIDITPTADNDFSAHITVQASLR